MFKKPQNNKCTNRSNLKAIVSNSELYLKLISTDLYKAVTWNRVVFRSCCFLGFSAFEKCAGSGITKNSRTVPPSCFHGFEAQGSEFYPTSAVSLEPRLCYNLLP